MSDIPAEAKARIQKAVGGLNDGSITTGYNP
jgi:hypothetical protein